MEEQEFSDIQQVFPDHHAHVSLDSGNKQSPGVY